MAIVRLGDSMRQSSRQDYLTSPACGAKRIESPFSVLPATKYLGFVKTFTSATPIFERQVHLAHMVE